MYISTVIRAKDAAMNPSIVIIMMMAMVIVTTIRIMVMVRILLVMITMMVATMMMLLNMRGAYDEEDDDHRDDNDNGDEKDCNDDIFIALVTFNHFHKRSNRYLITNTSTGRYNLFGQTVPFCNYLYI